ncbi:MAG: 4-hydroxy-tetrahydrodipicolinate synthase [Spirochaetae bacterium HGW-Spirochaetae-4]|jgi:4-hydroxy-tetrahydrodipicolinate synthase|nr:MAG: 4-hydroxy-tetrahydrodipicolinate synthase [Spirochaetes bacterium GWF2_52_7]PKL21160.1 MAG: 4-hydroxy-tetrahydrodipicolinate synthase [Spirochaetae bacterium HGW-Spirochaetae-4]
MIQGVFTALVTPFNKDGSIDLGAYKALIEFQITQGIDGLVPVGTTGESPTLDSKEKELLIQVAVEMADKKIPVIAGTGANNTKAAIEATRRAKDLGADMTLQVAPYYNKPSEEGLYRHFTTIADEAALPVVLYNVPGRSSVNMSVSLLLRLAQHPGIVAVKEASGSMSQIEDLLNKRPTTFSVLSGDDALTLPMVACGAQGIISVAGNMFPKEMVDMTHAALAGDMRKALQIHNHLYPFFVNQFIETNPVPIKTYMASKGMMEEVFRLPLCELREQNRKTLLATFG